MSEPKQTVSGNLAKDAVDEMGLRSFATATVPAAGAAR